MQKNPIEKCVICGKDTPYRFNDHIDIRLGYVEGSGQGCYQPTVCEKNSNYISVSKDLVHSTPNDQELGEKVRSIYWENK
jgi:hypothetical protein